MFGESYLILEDSASFVSGFIGDKSSLILEEPTLIALLLISSNSFILEPIF